MKIIAGKEPGSKTVGSVPLALPPPNTTRWVASRKAAVVAAVQNGVLTKAEACRRYHLSPEEFWEWERHYEAGGLPSLRAGVRLHHPDYPTH
jgi:transposase-like protein